MTYPHYSGDANIEQGGIYFADLDTDHVMAVSVTNVGSAVGGYDRLWLVERGSIYMPRDKWQDALSTCGYLHEVRDGVDVIVSGESGEEEAYPVTTKDGLTLLVDAFNAYWGLDGPDREVVQIGKPTKYDEAPAWEPDLTLRGNRKLARYLAEYHLA